MSEQRQRDNWGPDFREAVAKGRKYGLAFAVLAVLMMRFGGSAALEWSGLVAFLVALGAVFPNSPVLPFIVQHLPKLPTKAGGE